MVLTRWLKAVVKEVTTSIWPPPRLRYVVPSWNGPAGNHVSPYHTRALRMQQEAAMTICAVYALTDQQADRKAYEFVPSPGIEIVANLSFSG